MKNLQEDIIPTFQLKREEVFVVVDFTLFEVDFTLLGADFTLSVSHSEFGLV